jgi:acetoin utilization deacetylase AcuC-like enzyme
LVIDLDVHQGNGTAEIFANESRVFTFSMHGKENYPLHKEISDFDIELPTYTTDDNYLNLLYDTLPRLIQRVQPQFLFYISGVDILATDKLGKLSVSMEACKR